MSLGCGWSIVIDVIKTKQAEKDEAKLKAEKARKRHKILELINAKNDEKLSAASIEDLEKELATL